ncbi:MAG: helix-turn-helix domain-containing protein [Planctomycetota bacterium]|jgi:transposase
MKQYIVELTSEERSQLQQIVAKGNTTGYRIKYAHILLKANQAKGGPGWSDPRIAEAFECNVSTVYRLRKRLIEDGFDAVLQHGNTGKHKQRKLDGTAEAHLIALACSEPPKGRQRWTVRLLADELVSLGIVDSCGKTTVHETLKKMNYGLI